MSGTGLRKVRADPMIPTLLAIHIAIAAAWFGHKLLIPGDIRMSLHAGQEESEALLGRLRRAQRLGILTGLGTLLSGAALMWVIGLDLISLWIWIGLALVLVAIGIGATVARPAMKRLEEAVGREDRVDAIVAGRQVNRVLGVESLLWIGALMTMLV